MKKVYLFVRWDWDGCSLGRIVYSSREKAEYDLMLCQENPDSEYYNHPLNDIKWEVTEFDFNEEIL